MLTRAKQLLFENGATRQTIMKNTVWLFVGEMGMRLLKLVIFVYAARKLGISEWGAFSYAFALMSIFSAVSDIGINAVLLKEVARKKDSIEHISTGFFLKVALSVAASIVLWGTMFFWNNGSAVRLLIPFMAIMLFLDNMREFGFSLNRAFEKMEIEAAGKLLAASVLVVAGFAFIVRDPTGVSLAWAYILGSGISLGFMCIELRPYGKDLFSRLNKDLLIPLLRESWPLALVSIFGILLTNVDTVILGLFKSTAEVGLYAAAQKPIQVIYTIPTLISISLLPAFSRLASSVDKEKMREAISKSLNLTFLIALPIAAGALFLLGGPLIIFLFGSSYAQAGSPFTIMTAAILVNAPGMILSNALFAESKQRRTAVAILAGVIANFIVSFALIPRFGLYGAAIAATAGQVVSNGFIIISARQIPSLRFSLRVGKIFLATVVMSAVLLLIRTHVPFLITILLSMAAYGLALIVFQEETVKDMRAAIRA